MNNEKEKQLQENEVAIAKEILDIFYQYDFTYKQAVDFLPKVKNALTEISLHEKVRKVSSRHHL